MDLRWWICADPVGGMPVGCVAQWVGVPNLPGWVLPDGRVVKRDEFPLLAPLVRYPWGTSWWAWHVRREVRLPDVSARV